jgi:hypothetical protein
MNPVAFLISAIKGMEADVNFVGIKHHARHWRLSALHFQWFWWELPLHQPPRGRERHDLRGLRFTRAERLRAVMKTKIDDLAGRSG